MHHLEVVLDVIQEHVFVLNAVHAGAEASAISGVDGRVGAPEPLRFIALPEAEHSVDELRLERVTLDGTDNDGADEVHGIEEATHITQPIKYAVSLPLDHLLVEAKINLDAGEFVS
jgi:hypothetical protein